MDSDGSARSCTRAPSSSRRRQNSSRRVTASPEGDTRCSAEWLSTRAAGGREPAQVVDRVQEPFAVGVLGMLAEERELGVQRFLPPGCLGR